jgi:hypothetical protein
MPTKYDPDTGIPYFVAEVAIELEEGVTPEPNTIITSKRHLFAGDPPPRILGQKPTSSTTKAKKDDFPDRLAKAFGVEPPPQIACPSPEVANEPPAGPPDSPVQTAYDEAFDVDKLAKRATPAALSAKIATDAEIEEIERLAREHSVMHWPTLMRLINRLRMTEELLRVERKNRA